MKMPGAPAVYLRYPRLHRNPRRCPPDVRRLQEAKLARLAVHAGARVPYYRELFRSAGLRPEDVRTLDALRALPLTSKETLRGLSVRERTAEGVDLARCRSFSTSGTTGIPLRSWFTPADATMKNMGWIRAQRACGLSLRDKTAAFIGQRQAESRRSWHERLGIGRRREIPSWDPPEEWLRRLREWRPDILLGYVMTLRILAETLWQSGAAIPLKSVFHSSAMLDAPSRRFLEEAFGCPVRDFYGSDEAGCIAWECPECDGYHIAADLVIVEILKDGRPAGPGEEGEVVVTNLHSRAMPFLRYRQGDVAILSSRAPVCGRSFPLLDRIQGRTDDFLVLPGRGRITPHVVYHLLDPIDGLRRWRIEQEELRRIRVECEPAAEPGPGLSREVESRLRTLIPEEVVLDIRIVDAIPIPPGRKFRAVSSRVGGTDA